MQEDVRAIDRLKSIQQQQERYMWTSSILWSYEDTESGESIDVEFDDQTCLVLEAHREKCNRA